MPIAVGTKAPDFTLKNRQDSKMSDVTLSDHLGKDPVVLLFFPGAFTTPCTKELCDISLSWDLYSSLGAVVYGVSVDSVFAQEAWAADAGIKIPLLSDYQRKVCRAYEVTVPDFAGLGEGCGRAAFVIDRDGVVRYAEQTAQLGDMPNFAALVEALKAL